MPDHERAMVYNILGTAALLTGIPLEVFQSSKRVCRETTVSSGHDGKDVAVAGHLLHPAPLAQGLNVQSSRAWGSGGDAGGDSDDDDEDGKKSHNLKGLFKDNRYVQRARNDDFFYSLVHSTPHTRKMLGDIMQKLKNMHTDMASLEHGDVFRDTVGGFFFEYLPFAVTLLAVVDSIQILKQNTDRYAMSADYDLAKVHPPGWSTTEHYKNCEVITKPTVHNKSDLPYRCVKSGYVQVTGKHDNKCPCCRTLDGDLSNPKSMKCNICEPLTHKPKLIMESTMAKNVLMLHNKNWYDELVYPSTSMHTPGTVLAISGHLASLLALHAFLHNDLLRPGNAAPVYNVHITMHYHDTLCQGLLLRKLHASEREQLSPIMHMMTYHELWINVDSADIDEDRENTFVQCSSRDVKNIRRPLFHAFELRLKLDKTHDLSVGNCITPQGLITTIYKMRETNKRTNVYIVRMSNLFKSGIYWPCVDDYFVIVEDGHRLLFRIDQHDNSTTHERFLLVPRHVKLYKREGDTTTQQDGYDSDDADEECRSKNLSAYPDRTDTTEFTTLVLKVESGDPLFYRSYRWRALPTAH